MRSLREWVSRFFSTGALLILLIAICCTVVVIVLPIQKQSGFPMWTFVQTHFDSYERLLGGWNRAHPQEQFDIQLLQGSALESRMLSGFLAGTPVADVIEAERSIAAKAFLGPLQDIGFVDLTSRLHAEGIYDQINTPSFSPYTTRGHIFGLPHDVHPVLLAYRADLVEAAGIDVSTIETWDDYFRVMRPLMQDLDGDSRPDRYLLSAWDTRTDTVQILVLQAGGTFFDADDQPLLNNPRNSAILARIVTWITGPNRVCADVNPGASGYLQILDGFVIGTMMPDWMAGTWKLEVPRMGGKLKLMPLPAWEKGGRRTSVFGGTMIGIAKSSQHVDAAWNFIKYLYLSPSQAEYLFRKTSIISPVKSVWSQPFYDEPDPYFSGQPSGRLFIRQAPDVPMRSSSPYMDKALQDMISVLMAVRVYADDHEDYDQTSLSIVAQRLLDDKQVRLKKLINRNQFLGSK